MSKHLTPSEHRKLSKRLRSYRVGGADTSAKDAKKEQFTQRLNAERQIRNIVASGIEIGTPLEKIHIKCSVLQKFLGYDPKNYVNKLYYEYIKEKDNGHEDR